MGPFYLPYEFTSVRIAAGNADPFGIDPEQTVAIATGNADAWGIDPEQTVPLVAANTLAADPWGVDPEQTLLVVTGLYQTTAIVTGTLSYANEVDWDYPASDFIWTIGSSLVDAPVSIDIDQMGTLVPLVVTLSAPLTYDLTLYPSSSEPDTFSATDGSGQGG